jgi:membrane protein DedA with SNARE-associated domain
VRQHGAVRRVANLQDPRERWTIAVLLVPIVATSIASWVGEALSPTLLVNSPLLLVFLTPALRYVVFAAPQTDFVPFFVVVVIRLLLADPAFFVFGYRYGDAGIRWVEEKSGSPGALSWIERWFRRASYPLVAVMPSGLVCALSGAAGLSVPVFLVLNVVGTMVRVTLIWWLGDVFSEPLLDVVGFVARYQWWLTGATVVIVTSWLLWSGHRGRLRIETPAHVEEELEEFEAEIEAEEAAERRGDGASAPSEPA